MNVTKTLVLGGVKSGKSRHAQVLAEGYSKDDVVFIATARAGDTEMQQRKNCKLIQPLNTIRWYWSIV